LSIPWLPRTRGGKEQLDDLTASFLAAIPPAEALIAAFNELGFNDSPQNGNDSQWWLHKVIETHVNEELAGTLPSVRIDAEGDDKPNFRVARREPEQNAEFIEIGWLNPCMVDQLSDGERVWFDEALGSAVQHLDRLTHRNQLRVSALRSLDDESRLAIALHVADRVEPASRQRVLG
jgi:hypothetical protein